jgi:amidase
MTDLANLDATAQAELVRDGSISPTELVDAAIERVEKLNPELNAVIHPRFEAARAEAADVAVDAPFRGVPMVVKDLDGYLAGEPWYGGNRALREAGYTPKRTSYLFERFQAAGFVIVGKTNTPEFGLMPSTEPLTCGPTRNPWNLEHSTGGSSGGSAAAVAAGLVPIGHAGDGGGSIRIPASECGLVGLKPSRARISLGPDEGEAWNGFVQRFVVSLSVRDAATILDAVQGPAIGDPYAALPPTGPYRDALAGPKGTLRIGLMTAAPGELVPVDAECVGAAEAAARLLESLGHHVEAAYPAALDDPSLLGFFTNIVNSNAAHEVEFVERVVGRPVTPDDFEPSTWMFAEGGRAVSAPALIESVAQAHRWSRGVTEWWNDFDILVTPTLAELPPRLGDLQTGATGDPFVGLMRATAFCAFTVPFNVTGQPAISVPLAQSASALPIGVQLVAAPWREDVCLALAAQLEAAAPWADRRPPVHA